MAGNSIGRLFRLTTFGESHGQAIGCVVDGVPPGIRLSEADLQIELNRRKPGSSIYTTARKEEDKVQILSGVFQGMTTGTSIGLLIANCDQQSVDYAQLKNKIRPGHADYVYQQKYGIRDHRGGGRASARETALRVAAGAIAKKFLHKHFGVTIRGYLSQMGSIQCALKHWDETSNNPFFCGDPDKVPLLEKQVTSLKTTGDSIGAEVKVIAEQVPIGLGDPVFDKLDADLAKAFMSINAVKGVEIGDGFEVIKQLGSEHRDEINHHGFLSNHAGGIVGGISTGQPIIATLALKPASSIPKQARSLNLEGEEILVSTGGRHDPCVGIRAVPVAEAMMAIVIMDHYLCYRGQCGTVKPTITFDKVTE